MARLRIELCFWTARIVECWSGMRAVGSNLVFEWRKSGLLLGCRARSMRSAKYAIHFYTWMLTMDDGVLDCSRFAKWRWKYGWRRWNVGYRLVQESISVEGVVVREFKAWPRDQFWNLFKIIWVVLLSRKIVHVSLQRKAAQCGAQCRFNGSTCWERYVL